jgi:hypothetical protein
MEFTPSWGTQNFQVVKYIMFRNTKWVLYFIRCGCCLIKVSMLRIYLERYDIPKCVVNKKWTIYILTAKICSYSTP